MKAMILAAGLGTRLQHLTENKPKALVEVKGKTLLERSIRTLTQAGVDDIIINVHHYAPLIIDFLKRHKFDASISISDESNLLLDTGGGIKNTASFFNDNNPFVIYNVDIISDINLKAMLDYHRDKKPLASLAVRQRDTQRYLLFDENMRLCGRYNAKTEEQTLVFPEKKNCRPLAFSGIHVLSPEVFNFMPDEKVFSITDFYVHIANKQTVMGYEHNEGYWMDMGKLKSIEDGANLNI